MLIRVMCALALIVLCMVRSAHAQEQGRQPSDTVLCRGGACGKFFAATKAAHEYCGGDNVCVDRVKGLRLYGEYCLYLPDDYTGKFIASSKRLSAQWILGAAELDHFSHKLAEVATYGTQTQIYAQARFCIDEVTARLLGIMK